MLTGIVGTELLMFLLGFSSITTVYEISKTTKSSKSSKIQRGAEKIAKHIPKQGDEDRC